MDDKKLNQHHSIDSHHYFPDNNNDNNSKNICSFSSSSEESLENQKHFEESERKKWDHHMHEQDHHSNTRDNLHTYELATFAASIYNDTSQMMGSLPKTTSISQSSNSSFPQTIDSQKFCDISDPSTFHTYEFDKNFSETTHEKDEKFRKKFQKQLSSSSTVELDGSLKKELSYPKLDVSPSTDLHFKYHSTQTDPSSASCKPSKNSFDETYAPKRDTTSNVSSALQPHPKPPTVPPAIPKRPPKPFKSSKIDYSKRSFEQSTFSSNNNKVNRQTKNKEFNQKEQDEILQNPYGKDFQKQHQPKEAFSTQWINTPDDLFRSNRTIENEIELSDVSRYKKNKNEKSEAINKLRKESESKNFAHKVHEIESKPEKVEHQKSIKDISQDNHPHLSHQHLHHLSPHPHHHPMPPSLHYHFHDDFQTDRNKRMQHFQNHKNLSEQHKHYYTDRQAPNETFNRTHFSQANAYNYKKKHRESEHHQMEESYVEKSRSQHRSNPSPKNLKHKSFDAMHSTAFNVPLLSHEDANIRKVSAEKYELIDKQTDKIHELDFDNYKFKNEPTNVHTKPFLKNETISHEETSPQNKARKPQFIKETNESKTNISPSEETICVKNIIETFENKHEVVDSTENIYSLPSSKNYRSFDMSSYATGNESPVKNKTKMRGNNQSHEYYNNDNNKNEIHKVLKNQTSSEMEQKKESSKNDHRVYTKEQLNEKNHSINGAEDYLADKCFEVKRSFTSEEKVNDDLDFKEYQQLIILQQKELIQQQQQQLQQLTPKKNPKRPPTQNQNMPSNQSQQFLHKTCSNQYPPSNSYRIQSNGSSIKLANRFSDAQRNVHNAPSERSFKKRNNQPPPRQPPKPLIQKQPFQQFTQQYSSSLSDHETLEKNDFKRNSYKRSDSFNENENVALFNKQTTRSLQHLNNIPVNSSPNRSPNPLNRRTKPPQHPHGRLQRNPQNSFIREQQQHRRQQQHSFSPMPYRQPSFKQQQQHQQYQSPHKSRLSNSHSFSSFQSQDYFLEDNVLKDYNLNENRLHNNNSYKFQNNRNFNGSQAEQKMKLKRLQKEIERRKKRIQELARNQTMFAAECLPEDNLMQMYQNNLESLHFVDSYDLYPQNYDEINNQELLHLQHQKLVQHQLNQENYMQQMSQPHDVFSSVEYLVHKSEDQYPQHIQKIQQLQKQQQIQHKLQQQQIYNAKLMELYSQQQQQQRQMQQHYNRKSGSEYSLINMQPTFKGSMGYLNEMAQDDNYNYPVKHGIESVDPNEARVIMMMMQDLPVTEDIFNYDLEQSFGMENKDDVILRHDYKDYVYLKQQQQLMSEQQKLQNLQTRCKEVGTPAMNILDDVTNRTRNLLRDIGSRPLSDDLDKYFQGLLFRDQFVVFSIYLSNYY